MKRAICLAVVAAGAILASVGCGSHRAVPAARSASATPSAVATSVNTSASTGVSPTADPSAPARPASPSAVPAKPPGAATTGAAAGPAASAAADAACSVSTDTLTSALATSSDQRFSEIAVHALLTDPECYQGFATARAEPKQSGQSSRVLFGYDAAAKAWRPLNVGSAGYCAGFAPDAIAVHFTGCA